MSFSIKTLSGELIAVEWPSTRAAIAQLLNVTPFELKLFKGGRTIRYVEYEVEKDDLVYALIEEPEWSIKFTNRVPLENGLEQYDVEIARQHEIKCSIRIVIMWDSSALLGGQQPFTYELWDSSIKMVKDYPAFSYISVFEYTFYHRLHEILSTSDEIWYLHIDPADINWLETRIDKFIEEEVMMRKSCS